MSSKSAAPRRDFRSLMLLGRPYSLKECGVFLQLDFLRSLRGMRGTLSLKGRIVLVSNGDKGLKTAVLPYSR